jgi:hypothetical protein
MVSHFVPSATRRARAGGGTYVFVFITFFLMLLGAILGLNLLLGERGLGSAEATRLASVWQEQTKGVTYAPPITHTRPFKVLRLTDRLPQINTIVLGSSTVMGITADMFPAPMQVYNFALTGNGTVAVVGEAQYIERHFSEHIRWIVAGLDWSVGMLYQQADVGTMDLSANGAAQGYARRDATLFKRIEDALTWPRVSNLGTLLKAVLQSGTPLGTFRHLFFDIAGAPYRCADGALARDFDVINLGLCRGYRYDGSWTFANDSHLSAAQAATLAMAATAASSKYTQHLCTGGGTPNARYLQQLGDTARRLAARGGRMVFLLPPLVPGMEQALLANPRWRACLEHTKSILQEWAVKNDVTVIDAGAAERYGCETTEFVDEHHAYPACNRRVLTRFFSDVAAGRVKPGLYQVGRP